MKFCAFIVLNMTAGAFHFNAIPLVNYDVMYYVTTSAKGTPF